MLIEKNHVVFVGGDIKVAGLMIPGWQGGALDVMLLIGQGVLCWAVRMSVNHVIAVMSTTLLDSIGMINFTQVGFGGLMAGFADVSGFGGDASTQCLWER